LFVSEILKSRGFVLLNPRTGDSRKPLLSL